MRIFEKLKEIYLKSNDKSSVACLQNITQSIGGIMDNTDQDTEKTWIGYSIMHTVFYYWTMFGYGQQPNIVERLHGFDSYDVDSLTESLRSNYLLSLSSVMQRLSQCIEDYYLIQNLNIDTLLPFIHQRLEKQPIRLLGSIYDYALSKSIYPKECVEKIIEYL